LISTLNTSTEEGGVLTLFMSYLHHSILKDIEMIDLICAHLPQFVVIDRMF